MSKEFDLLDAFIALDKIDDEEVESMLKKRNLKEGKEYSIYSSNNDFAEAKRTLAEKDDQSQLEVVDVDADTVEHLKNNNDYVGDYLLACSKCGRTRFAQKDSFMVDPEDSEFFVMKVDDGEIDECPVCHVSNPKYTIAGQVGAYKDPNASEEPAIDNDQTSAEDGAAFDNDLEAPAEEPVESEPAADLDLDEPISTASDEESDGMDTTTSEDELDDLDLPELGDEPSDDVAADDTEDEEEHVKEALNEEYEFQNELGAEAWKLGQIILHMNNEEAYYGSWLYIWPDEEDKESCDYDFADREAYDDLERAFIKTYKAYHEDGLYDAPDDVVADAHAWDDKLGLRAIDNIKRKARPVYEALEADTVNDLLAMITNPESISDILVYNNTGDSSDLVYEGGFEDIPDDILTAAFGTFDTADGYLTCNVDTSSSEGTTLTDVLEAFDDEFTEKIMIWDEDVGDTVFEGDKEDAVGDYGQAKFISFEAPDRLQINISDANIVRENVATEATDESLFEAICKANDLSAYKVNNIKTNEYWLNESLQNTEDLDYVFRHYVLPTANKSLIERFKKETGYKDAVDEAYEKMNSEINPGEHLLDFNPDDFANDDRDAQADKWEEIERAKEEVAAELADVDESMQDSGFEAWYDDLSEEDRIKVDNLADDSGLPAYEDCSDAELASLHDQFESSRSVEECNESAEDVCPECGKNPCECKCNDGECVEECNEAAKEEKQFAVRRLDGKFVDASGTVGGGARATFDTEEEAINFISDNGKFAKWDNNFEIVDLKECVNEEVTPVEECRSFKSRKDLSAAIEECKNNNRPYSVRRSMTEGYRYDLITEAKKDEEIDKVLDTVDKIEQHADLINDEVDAVEQYDDAIKQIEDSKVQNKDELISRLHHIKGEELEHIDELEGMADLLPKAGELADEPEKIDEPVEDEQPVEELPAEAPVEADLEVPADLPVEEAPAEEPVGEALNEAEDEEVEEQSDVDAAVEDDIGADADAEDAPIPAEEAVTIENADTVEEVNDEMEDVEFEGEVDIKPIEVADGAHEVEEINVTQTEDGVEVEIKADPEPMPAEEGTEGTEDTDSTTEDTPEEAAEDPELDFDTDTFDADVNNYFDEAYEDTMIYRTVSGKIDASGKVILEGLIKSDENLDEAAVTFTLTPIDKLDESLTQDVVSNRTYKVSNDLSEEEFEFKI